jgi:acyl carrier protein phosphodiesterase
MNFLGHVFLSGTPSKVMVGNFLGDFVRKSQIEHWNHELQKGFKLHHEIDRFTDSHELVRQSKQRLVPKYRHYASVIVDIYYDHFLSKNWRVYSDIELKSYTTNTYEFLVMHDEVFPEKALRTLQYMKSTDWLYNYQYMDGIEMALTGMSRRAKFDSKMDLAIHDLKNDYELYEQEFKDFMPEIEYHIKKYLSTS